MTSLFVFSACAAPDSATGAKDAPAAEKEAPPEAIGIARLVAIIAAIGALGVAAFSLVHATKAFWGGVSNVGLPGLNHTVRRFSVAFSRMTSSKKIRPVTGRSSTCVKLNSAGRIDRR